MSQSIITKGLSGERTVKWGMREVCERSGVFILKALGPKTYRLSFKYIKDRLGGWMPYFKNSIYVDGVTIVLVLMRTS